MLAVNDNLTAAEFGAGVDPNHRPAVLVLPMTARTVIYEFVRLDRIFRLTRLGMTRIFPEMRHAPGPIFAAVATAGSPHNFCPPHRPLPEPARAMAAALREAKRPAYIRGVVTGTALPSDKPAAPLRAV